MEKRSNTLHRYAFKQKKKIYIGTRRKKNGEVSTMTRKTSMDSTVGNRSALCEISAKSFTMEVSLVYSLYLMNLFSFDIGSYLFSIISLFSLCFITGTCLQLFISTVYRLPKPGCYFIPAISTLSSYFIHTCRLLTTLCQTFERGDNKHLAFCWT